MALNKKGIAESSTTRQELECLYEEVMWLRARPNITSSVARSWYTHVCAERLKKKIRRFSGQISIGSLEPDLELRLEHHLRIQTTLTQLVERHYNTKVTDAEDFISTLLRCEEVHIVTRDENYAAMKAKGDYKEAGIELVSFRGLDEQIQTRLWPRMLQGRVSNYMLYKP